MSVCVTAREKIVEQRGKYGKIGKEKVLNDRTSTF